MTTTARARFLASCASRPVRSVYAADGSLLGHVWRDEVLTARPWVASDASTGPLAAAHRRQYFATEQQAEVWLHGKAGR